MLAKRPDSWNHRDRDHLDSRTSGMAQLEMFKKLYLCFERTTEEMQKQHLVINLRPGCRQIYWCAEEPAGGGQGVLRDSRVHKLSDQHALASLSLPSFSLVPTSLANFSSAVVLLGYKAVEGVGVAWYHTR